MALSKKITYLPVIWQLRKLLLFLKFFIIALSRYQDVSLLKSTWHYLPQWNRTVKRDNDPLSYDQPWIVFGAIDFLKAILAKDMVVWEYGSGSSTLFYARRVEKVYSVENDELWYNHLERFLEEKQITNVTYMLHQDEGEAKLTDEKFVSKSANKLFRKYVESIDIISDNSLDIVMIDGRARSSCISQSIPKVKKGGYLIVDNSDRDYFANNQELFHLDKWEAKHFVGQTPYTFSFSKTSFFKRIS